MAAVTVEVVAYPFAGVVGFQAEEATLWGWVQVLDTAVVGVFPTYTTSYALTVTDATHPIRVRWEISADHYTAWFNPSTKTVPITAEQTERIAEALIQKATRILSLAKAPLGYSGDLLDEMVTTVRSDRQIDELLYGLRFRNWNVDLTALVTTADVIRVGLQAEPADFPAERLADVQRAIDAAVSWIAEYLLDGAGVA